MSKHDLPALAVFAGGKASRLGGVNKSRITFNGETFIARIAAEFSHFSEKLFLSGEEPNAPQGFIPIIDIHQGIGPLGALHAALLATHADSIFVLACDMPFINTDTFKALYSSFNAENDAIMAMSSQGLEPLCSIYRTSCLPAIENMIEKKEHAIRNLSKYLRIQTLCFEQDSLFININTPFDLKKLGINTSYPIEEQE